MNTILLENLHENESSMNKVIEYEILQKDWSPKFKNKHGHLYLLGFLKNSSQWNMAILQCKNIFHIFLQHLFLKSSWFMYIL